jgi:hypothetical protein
MRPFRLKLATALVAMYPQAWRERYADEMQSLFADRSIAWRDLIDLIRGCGSEWWVSLTDPEIHPLAFGIIFNGTPVLIAMAVALAFEVAAHALAPVLNPSVREAGLAVVVLGPMIVPFLLFVRVMLPTHGSLFRISHPARRWFLTWHETSLWMALVFVQSLSLARQQGPSRFTVVMQAFVPLVLLLANTGNRGQRPGAFQAFRIARRELRHAERELSREQSRPPVFANGRALRQAQAEVDRLTRVSRLACARMRGLSEATNHERTDP